MKKITLLFMLCLAAHGVNAQDSCASPGTITVGGLYGVGPINGAAPTLICADNGDIPANPAGEWYSYTPTQNYTVTISTGISQNVPLVDTRIHVYTGVCGSLVCHAGDDDSGAGDSSTVIFNAIAGTPYKIVFDNRWSPSGFTFQVTEGSFVPPAPTPISFTSQTIPTIITGSGYYNLCGVDMNGDFRDDIVGVNATNIKIHYQNANGTFTVTDIPTTTADFTPSWSIAAGDYNKDGFNDLLYGAGQGLTLMRSNSTGTAFTEDSPGQYIFCQRTNFVDINSDGHLDAFSCHDVDPNVYYINNGAGVMTYYQSGVTPGAYTIGIIPNGGNYSTLWSDFDNDGDSDVFISKCSGPPCELWRSEMKQGLNSYTDVSIAAAINVTPIQSWSSAIADYDNDGDMDVVIGASSGTHRFFRNNLDTTNSTEEAFTNITAGSGLDANISTSIEHIAYDFNNDGYVDIMGGGNKIMFNQGNSTFVGTAFAGLSVGAVADFNNDGFLDIQNNNVLKINSGNNNKWIKVGLKGIQSNSNGIGSRVEIYGAFGKQIRDIRSGEGFKYMGSLNAHFGIGQATSVAQVVIRWPSGIVDIINNPTINQMMTVVEGSTLAIESFTNASFSLYPNPAQHVLNIKTNDNIEMKSAQVYDLNGRVILESEVTNDAINVESLATGTYILLLRDTNGKDYSQKFLKE